MPLLRAIVWSWFAFFFFIPLARLFFVGVSSPHFFFAPDVLQIVWRTVYQASLSTLISIALGIPLGWRYRREGSVQTLLSVPFMVPTLVAATAWVYWLGRRGPLQTFLGIDFSYSLSAVVIAHVFFNAPWVALQVSECSRRIPNSLLQQARSLGLSRWGMGYHVVWPLIRLSLFTVTCQVFTFCLMSFALVLVLGGGPPVETLETAIYTSLRFGIVDFDRAVAVAFWEVFLCGVPWMGILLARKKPIPLNENLALEDTFEKKGRRGGGRVWAFFFLVPYTVVLLQLFTFPEWASVEDGRLFLSSLELSFALALTTSVLTILLALLGCEVGPAWVFGLPSGVSALVLSLSYLLMFGSRMGESFFGKFSGIVLIQVFLFLPFVFRLFWSKKETDAVGASDLKGVAHSLGANRGQYLRWIWWPQWRRVIGVALLMMSGASLGELASVSLFAGGDFVPLSLLLSRWMSQYRFDAAEWLASVLLFLILSICFVLFFINSDSFQNRKWGIWHRS